jgi:SAM-dependent methyltransferase
MIDNAIAALLSEFSWNPWFLNSFWPENQYRIRLIVNDLTNNVPVGSNVLDIGCANGFLSFLVSQLGYRVFSMVAEPNTQRDALFAKHGIEFVPCNLNEPTAFDAFADDSFAAVIMGEVIEHILNHPLGLMRDVASVTRDGGILLLTTPNPTTVANAYRTLRGTNSLWGTPQFMDEPKIHNAQVTDIGDVHYREYRAVEVSHLLIEAGFVIERFQYFAYGISREQPAIKRFLKGNPLARKMMSQRAFGANQYCLARRVG